jgi:RND family efflux transporter MFP subunit
MKRLLRILLPGLVLVAGIAIGLVLMATGPEAKRRPPPPSLPAVEVLPLKAQDYVVRVRSQGSVLPRTQSTLIPEVAGRVVAISPQFRNGGFFEPGEVLLRLDPADYDSAITIARADLARARLALAQEEALAQHALEDWQKLNRKDKPSDLTLHKPQVASAKAEVAAAEARLRQAEANLQRTRIVAPYAGRVLEKKVDVGQYVSPGTVAATVYAVDYAEIRLPLTDKQQGFVDLPEAFADGNTASSKPAPAVTLHAHVGGRDFSWPGRLVRTEGAIDTASRQLFVVAQVDSPYAHHGDNPPLKVGQFVEAEIGGHTLRDVFVLPRAAVESGDRVLLLTAENRIQRRAVTVALRQGEQVIVSAGLEAGERVVTTPMPFASDGMEVVVSGDNPNKGKANTSSSLRRRPESSSQGESLDSGLHPQGHKRQNDGDGKPSTVSQEH